MNKREREDTDWTERGRRTETEKNKVELRQGKFLTRETDRAETEWEVGKQRREGSSCSWGGGSCCCCWDVLWLLLLIEQETQKQREEEVKPRVRAVVQSKDRSEGSWCRVSREQGSGVSRTAAAARWNTNRSSSRRDRERRKKQQQVGFRVRVWCELRACVCDWSRVLDALVHAGDEKQDRAGGTGSMSSELERARDRERFRVRVSQV